MWMCKRVVLSAGWITSPPYAVATHFAADTTHSAPRLADWQRQSGYLCVADGLSAPRSASPSHGNAASSAR